MRKSFFLFLFLALSLALAAQKSDRRDYVSVRFVPDHANWVYAVGEEVEIEVAAVRHYVPVPDAEVRYSWGMEQRELEQEGVVQTGKSDVQTLRLSSAREPGFKTLTARVEIGG